MTNETVDIETENQILSIGDEFLPACARVVRDGGEATDEYRTWLASQVAEMTRDAAAAVVAQEALDAQEVR